MIKKVKTYIEKYHMIAPGDTVIVGVSGGADSVCLLLMLTQLRKEIPFRIVVVHVDHGIREDAGQDAEYVRRLAGELGLPFYLVEADVKAYALEHHLSVEAAGRNIRYQAFADAVLREAEDGQGKIAVAHNLNDRAETMLFHLFRGTGLNGLGSIRPVRDNIIRPLLCLKREEIEEYLAKEKTSYCTDSTNAERIYTRNKIRHDILPVAKQICAAGMEHMAEAADTVSEAYDYIRQSAEQFCDNNIIYKDGRVIVDVMPFLSEHSVVQKEVIYQCLLKTMQESNSLHDNSGADGHDFIRNGHNITGTHIRDIRSLFLREENRKIMLPGDLLVKREYQQVIFIRTSHQTEDTAGMMRVKITEECDIPVPGLGTVKIRIFPYEKNKIIPQKTYTKWFDYDKIVKSLVLRTRETGDYLTINRDLCRKTLKSYMIQEKIPKDIRDRIYVLADGHHILWVIGYRISQQYKVEAQTKTILQIHVERKESVEWLKE